MHRSRLILWSILLVFTQSFGAAAEDQGTAQRALAYLRGRQDDTGRIESAATSAWAAIAFGAAGEDSGAALRNYLATHHPVSDDPVTEWERQVFAFLAMGIDPAAVDGRDYLAAIEGFAKGGQIGDPNLLNDDMFGILALVGAGRPSSSPIVADTAAFLLDHQNPDGGWGFAVGMPSDVDLTGIMLQLLPLLTTSSAKAESAATDRAVAFLRSVQNVDGGFPNGRGGPSNVASTAWAIQGLVAVAEDPTRWTQRTTTPYAYLAAAQRADGSFPWYPGGPASALMTSYAVPAILKKPLPILYAPPPSPPPLPPPPPADPAQPPQQDPLPPLPLPPSPPSPPESAPPQEQPLSPAGSDAVVQSASEPSLPASVAATPTNSPRPTQAPLEEPVDVSRSDTVPPLAREEPPPTRNTAVPPKKFAREQDTAAAPTAPGPAAPDVPANRSSASASGNTDPKPVVPEREPLPILELALVVILAGWGGVILWFHKRSVR